MNLNPLDLDIYSNFRLKNDDSSIMSTYGLSNKQLRRATKLLEPSRSWLNK